MSVDSTTDTCEVDGEIRPTKNSDGQLLGSNLESIIDFWHKHRDSLRTDDEGRPLVLLHGTRYMFETFEQKPGTVSTLFGIEEVKRYGHFFTTDRMFAQAFAGSNGVIKEVYVRKGKSLDLRNGFLNKDIELLAANGISTSYMFNLRPENAWEAFDGEDGEYLTDIMKKVGYTDSVLVEPDDFGRMVTTYVVLNAEDIITVQNDALSNQCDFLKNS